jgi:hypothetical protein
MQPSIVWSVMLLGDYGNESSVIVGMVQVLSSAEKALEYVENKYGKQDWEVSYDETDDGELMVDGYDTRVSFYEDLTFSRKHVDSIWIQRHPVDAIAEDNVLIEYFDDADQS